MNQKIDRNRNLQASVKRQVVALKNSPSQINQLSPVNLVQISYQGFLRSQGIKGGNAFISAVNNGNITAESLVQSEIDQGRLSSHTLENQGYLNVVQNQLDGLTVK